MTDASPLPWDPCAVLGAGIMGSGIAQVAARRGLRVRLFDVGSEFLERGLTTIRSALDREVRRGRLDPPGASEVLSRISPSVDLGPVRDCRFVIEAAPEDLALKQGIFRQLDKLTDPSTVLATNTSSLSITAIASVVRDPGRVVGLHFFNPVPAMELVEIIPGLRTSERTLEQAREFAEFLGKTVTHSRDYPGFVTTRAMAVLVNEAIWMLHDGLASREDIDQAHRLGFRHPLGPLELADLVGLDTLLAVLERLYSGFRDPKYRACPLLVNMVTAGKLGRKSGEGFYTYPRSANGSSEARP
jgi:3-hydroxybutyryl-CoA dehydrogenase